VYVDDVLVFDYLGNYNYGVKLCGLDGWLDKWSYVDFYVPGHTNKFPRIRITSDVNEDASTESWGIRELTIFLLD
jgi:hypothetical protein